MEFLFGVYSGLRYSDLTKFDKTKNVQNGNIVMQTQKSKTVISIKIHSKLLEAVNRINGPLSTNQDYNRSLKAVALACNIDKPLTSHIARHTFAVMWLNRGGSMDVLSRLLDHNKLETTQIYGKITSSRVDNEVMNVFD